MLKGKKYSSVMMTIINSDVDEPTSQCPSGLSHHMSNLQPLTSASQIVCVLFTSVHVINNNN